MSFTHNFSPDFAKKYGIEVAVLIHHFTFWIRYNKSLGKNFIEGRTWTYQNFNQIAAHFVYLSIHQIKRFVKKMIDEKILIKGKFNKNPYDHTIWYAFNDEALFGLSCVVKREDLEENENIDMVNSLDEENNSVNRTIDSSISHYRKCEAAPSRKCEIELSSIHNNIKEDSLNKIEREAIASPPPSFSSNSLKEGKPASQAKKTKSEVKEDSKKSYADFVRLTEEEYNTLLETNGKEKLQWMIDKLNSQKGSKGNTYKSDYHTMIKGGWVQNAYDKDVIENKSRKKSSASSEEINKMIAQKVIQTFGERHIVNYGSSKVQIIISVSYKDIEIGSGSRTTIVEFSDPQFKELLKGAMSKNGLQISKIKELS